jgi:hypothetical protein
VMARITGPTRPLDDVIESGRRLTRGRRLWSNLGRGKRTGQVQPLNEHMSTFRHRRIAAGAIPIGGRVMQAAGAHGNRRTHWS